MQPSLIDDRSPERVDKCMRACHRMVDPEAKVKTLIDLLIECRDALPAIPLVNARLRGVSLTLADRIEKCLVPWETTEDDPDGR